MKKPLLALLLTMISNSAVAEWTVVDFYWESNRVLLVDYDTIRKKGNLAKMWLMLDLLKKEDLNGKEFLSVIIQKEYDCEEEQERALYGSFHSKSSGAGQNVFTRDSPTSNWTPIVPGTANELLWKIACGKQLPFPYSVTTPPPVAPDWTSPKWMKYSDKDNGYLFHFDPTTIQKNNQFRKVWSLWSDKSRSIEKLYFIRRVLYEFDCEKEMVKVVNENSHPDISGKGNEHHWISRPDGEELEWMPVKNWDWLYGNHLGILFNIVC